MENIKEEIRKKIQCFSKVAWSNQDIMLALDIGGNKSKSVTPISQKKPRYYKGFKDQSQERNNLFVSWH